MIKLKCISVAKQTPHVSIHLSKHKFQLEFDISCKRRENNLPETMTKFFQLKDADEEQQ